MISMQSHVPGPALHSSVDSTVKVWTCQQRIQAGPTIKGLCLLCGTGEQAHAARQLPPCPMPAGLPVRGPIIVAARKMLRPRSVGPRYKCGQPTLLSHPRWTVAFLLTFSTVFRLCIDLIISLLK